MNLLEGGMYYEKAINNYVFLNVLINSKQNDIS